MTNALVVPPTEPKLRWEFVGMMFAVTAGEIGIKFGIIAQNAPAGGPSKFEYALPATCHLLVATLIVAASWVGWSRSRVSMTIRDVVSVFTPPFMVLIVDVLLVVCYFVMVETVELKADEATSTFAVHPSAKGESFWIFVMFIGYFLWDILTKGFIRPESEPRQSTRLRRILAIVKRIFSARCWERTWVSFLCLIIALGAWKLLTDVSDYWAVIYADAALVSLLLLFRALKDLRSALSKVDVETVAEFQRRKEEDAPRAGIFSVLCALTLVVFTVLACRQDARASRAGSTTVSALEREDSNSPIEARAATGNNQWGHS